MSFQKKILSSGFLLLFIFAFGQHPQVNIGDKSAWIEDITFSNPPLIQKNKVSGFYWLLVDNQDNLETDQYYTHNAYKILNVTGVQEMSTLTFNFDPEYQKVKLHTIQVIRNGEILDKLTLKNIQVVQREQNMERSLYDGRLTVIATLPDVRVGDIIDYSYTITGQNPIHQGKYTSAFALQYTLPIQTYRYSIFVPAGEKINYKSINNALEPAIESTGHFKQYTWLSKNTEAIVYETATPSWYNPAAQIYLSQYDNWKEVVDIYQQHYNIDSRDRAILKQKISEVIDPKVSDEEFIDQAVRFVQDKVRYLGFENGLNSHKPTNPLEVLGHRYGDCKDKSFLLCEILRTRGIKAYPMLVNSTNGENIPLLTPSPNVFDHCVVQMVYNDTYSYIDPTYNYQGGNYKNYFFPNYENGLVLKPGEKELTPLPEPENATTSITETFILDDVGGGASLEVKTIYSGQDADIRRQEFAANNLQEIQKNYTNFYSRLYPSIKKTKNLSYTDHRGTENEFIVVENYRIDSLWSISSENNQIIYAEFYPLSLESYLFPEKTIGRKMPLYLNSNIDITHKSIVYVPEAWTVSNDHSTFGNDGFLYDYDVHYKNATLKITHHYKTLSDYLPVEKIKSYFSEHEKAQENLSFFLTYNNVLANSSGTESVSYTAVGIVFFIIIILSFVCYKIYHCYDLPAKENDENKQIGGWLVLVAIGLCLSPIFLSYNLMTGGYFNAATWSFIFAGIENIKYGGILLFEMTYVTVTLIFSIFLIILFFQKRTIVPQLIIIFYCFLLLVCAYEALLVSEIMPQNYTRPEKQEVYTELFKTIVRSAIWIPYFIFSTRVAETFTQRIKIKNKESVEQP